MESRDIIIIVIIAVAYFPIIYSLQKRIRNLESDVQELKDKFK